VEPGAFHQYLLIWNNYWDVATPEVSTAGLSGGGSGGGGSSFGSSAAGGIGSSGAGAGVGFASGGGAVSVAGLLLFTSGVAALGAGSLAVALSTFLLAAALSFLVVIPL